MHFGGKQKILFKKTPKHDHKIFSRIIDLCWNWKDEKEFIKLLNWIVKDKLKGKLTSDILMENIIGRSFFELEIKRHKYKFDSSKYIPNMNSISINYQYLVDLSKVELMMDYVIENKILLSIPNTKYIGDIISLIVPGSIRTFLFSTVSFGELEDENNFTQEQKIRGVTPTTIFCDRLNELKEMIKDNLHPLHNVYGIKFQRIVVKING